MHMQTRCNALKKFYSDLNFERILLVGLGNPLLDICAKVEDDFLSKYDLVKGTAITAEVYHLPIYKDLLENYDVEYSAGGSVHNSLRACQWILQRPNACAFFGCVGNDGCAEVIEERANRDGVFAKYQYTKKAPTGKCAVLISPPADRTLVASLGAAHHFKIDHLLEKENQDIIAEAKYFYCSGYFLVVSVESAMLIAEKASKRNACFALNLSANFVPKIFMTRLKQILPYVDILFGNGGEAETFADVEGWDISDRKEIGRRLQCLDKKNVQRQRIVIITQGPLPILVADGTSTKEYVVPEHDVERIVDTNGAGDCFTGGFLAYYMMHKPMDECIRCGIYTAQYILGQNGVNFEGEPDKNIKL